MTKTDMAEAVRYRVMGMDCSACAAKIESAAGRRARKLRRRNSWPAEHVAGLPADIRSAVDARARGWSNETSNKASNMKFVAGRKRLELLRKIECKI